MKVGKKGMDFCLEMGKNWPPIALCSKMYTGKNKDRGTWVFRFRTFNLNHSWILSQLSYERVLYIKSFV